MNEVCRVKQGVVVGFVLLFHLYLLNVISQDGTLYPIDEKGELILPTANSFSSALRDVSSAQAIDLINKYQARSSLGSDAVNYRQDLKKVLSLTSMTNVLNRSKSLEELVKLYALIRLREKEAASIKSVSGKKITYGKDNTSEAVKYSVLADFSEKVTLIEVPAGEGTGFFISDRIILTAKHNLVDPETGNQFSKNKIVVKVAEILPVADGAVIPGLNLVPVGVAGSVLGGEIVLGKQKVRLDYGLIFLKKGKSGRALPFEFEQPVFDDRVCVLGYPLGKGPKIADSSNILIPSVLKNDEEKDKIFVKFKGDLYAEEAWFNALEGNDALPGGEPEPAFLENVRKRIERLRSRFENSFEPRDGGGYWFVSRMVTPGDPMISFALDSDTFGGNSGSPVISKESMRVVGLFVAGEDLEKLPFGMVHMHEEAIPLKYIWENIGDYLIEEVEDKYPDYKAELKDIYNKYYE